MADWVAAPLSAMGTLFMLAPLAALVPAIFFIFLYRRWRARSAAVVALAWTLYAGWEWMLQYGGWCDDDCNIRVDLLVIYPTLIALSVVAVVITWQRARATDRSDSHG